MKFSSDDFKRIYAEMPDEELRSLVRADLTEVARQCYDEELSRRGLPSAGLRRATLPAAAPEEPEEIAAPEEVPAEAVQEQEEEDLAPAAIFTSRGEAKDGRTLLQSLAIPAFLEDDTLTGGGFRLLVPVSYADQAREALGETQSG